MKYLITICVLLLFSCQEERMINMRLGDEYQNGIIFYLFQPGETFYVEGESHGLIAHKQDTAYIWGCNGIRSSSPDGRIGGGLITNQGILDRCTDGAVIVCNSLKDNWYLPNTKEMLELGKNRHLVPNLIAWGYWTCDGSLNQEAYAVNPYNLAVGKQSVYKKLLIRPIKIF